MALKFKALMATAGLLVSTMSVAANHGQHHGAGHAPSQQSQPVTAGMSVAKGVSATGCWIRLLPAPAPSGGYFVLKNDSAQPVSLVAAAAPEDYGMVMVHQTRHENGMSRMAMVDEIPVPSKGQVDFQPGGYHIMLEQPRRDVAVGDKVQLALILKSGEKVLTTCEVKPAGSMPMKGHMHH